MTFCYLCNIYRVFTSPFIIIKYICCLFVFLIYLHLRCELIFEWIASYAYAAYAVPTIRNQLRQKLMWKRRATKWQPLATAGHWTGHSSSTLNLLSVIKQLDFSYAYLNEDCVWRGRRGFRGMCRVGVEAGETVHFPTPTEIVECAVNQFKCWLIIMCVSLGHKCAVLERNLY